MKEQKRDLFKSLPRFKYSILIIPIFSLFICVYEKGLSVASLHWAAAHGHSNIVRILVQKLDVSVGSSDKDDKAAIHWAAAKGHQHVLNLLVKELGANVNRGATYREGTALHAAAFFNHKECVKQLVCELGADVNAVTDKGFTPLHLAVSQDLTDMVVILSKGLGAEVNIKTKSGVTALHLAAAKGNMDIVKALMAHTMIEHQQSAEAIILSLQAGHIEIVQYLLSQNGMQEYIDKMYTQKKPLEQMT